MGWLCLTRKMGETVNIGDNVTLVINRVIGNRGDTDCRGAA